MDKRQDNNKEGGDMITYCRSGLAALVLLFAGSASVQAAIIANGDFTTDTGTGLDWLDLDLTLGLSTNQVSAQTGLGGAFDGWQVATLDQVHTFMTNLGWIGPFDPANMSNIGFVAGFKAQTTSLLDDPADDINGTWFVNDPLDTFGSNRFSDNQTTGITSYSLITPIDPTIGQQDTGTFLVRTSAVPLPAAFWLFGSGLAFLIACTNNNRQQQKSVS